MYIAADIGSSFVKLALIDDSIITATEKRRTARIDTGKPWEYEYDADGAVSFIREYTDFLPRCMALSSHAAKGIPTISRGRTKEVLSRAATAEAPLTFFGKGFPPVCLRAEGSG